MAVDANLADHRNTVRQTGLAGNLGRDDVRNTGTRKGSPHALGDPFVAAWNSDVGANEVQTVRIQSGTGGTFTVTFSGQTTAAVAHNAAATAVEDALHALSNVFPGDVEVTKAGTTADHTYTLTFGGQKAKADQAQVTVNSTNVAGTEIVTIATTVAGSAT